MERHLQGSFASTRLLRQVAKYPGGADNSAFMLSSGEKRLVRPEFGGLVETAQQGIYVA